MTFIVSGSWATDFLAVPFLKSIFFFFLYWGQDISPRSIPLYFDKQRRKNKMYQQPFTPQEQWNYIR